MTISYRTDILKLMAEQIRLRYKELESESGNTVIKNAGNTTNESYEDAIIDL